jgi:ATP adenylyltransferase/5',5'''-P-1,P-4-tetraphosphate phosphorylase II
LILKDFEAIVLAMKTVDSVVIYNSGLEAGAD